MKSKPTLYFSLSILFAIAGGVTIYFSFRPFAPQRVAEMVSENLDKELQRVEDEAAGVLEMLKTNRKYVLPHGEGFAFYVYTRNEILLWTDNGFVPIVSSVSDAFELKLLKAGNSDYLARKWKISDQRFLIAVIPLYKKFSISNDYLKTEWNRRIFPEGNISILDANATLGIPVCVNEHCPFKISFIPQELGIRTPLKSVAIGLLSISILLLIAAVVLTLRRLSYPDVSFVILLLFLLALRIIMIELDFPTDILFSDLFNPQVFAASALNASLGDLLLNEVALFIVCYYLFKNLFRFRFIRFLQRHSAGVWLLSVLSGVSVLFGILFPFVVIQTLYNNSAIAVDITESIRFDGLRIAALVAIILSGVCAFLFCHVFVRLLIGAEDRLRIGASFLLAILIFVVINLGSRQPFVSSLTVGILYFVAVYWLRLYASLKRLSFSTFAYLFVAIFFISTNGAYAMNQYSRHEKIEDQFRFARQFLIDRDYFGEYLLRELAVRISKDAFIQTRLATPFFGKEAIRQKIRQVFLSSYFNKYEVEIYLFNALREPLNNRTDLSLVDLLSGYNQDVSRTDYEGIYFVRSAAGDITQKYLVVVPISRGKAVSGYVGVELSLKKIIPENVYPELLVDSRSLEFYRSREISYAVFVNQNVLYSSGVFNYERGFTKEWIGDSRIYLQGVHEGGYDHIAVEDENGRVAVVSSPAPSLTHALGNFSFLMVLGLVTILIFILIQGLVNVIEGSTLFFAARIQLFLNIAFFLPLIIVSAVTLRVTDRSTQNQMTEEYLAKAKKFSEQISAQLNRYVARGGGSESTFENEFANLARLTNIDANVYNARGVLMSTSQPLIFENNLVSNYMNATALQKIRDGENLFTEQEHVGSLQYFIAYATLKSPTSGELIGILGVPFFQSVYLMEKVRINIVANILNIFSLIFIGLVILSYFVSEWLTFPLTFITQSLRKTSLTKTNHPLVWKSDDEIGLMVKEYNQMLYKLGESKAELEQTQRELAWREIAQQVAHEIKNPLTPMKLTLQQLERALIAGPPTNEKISKAIDSLLSQVNTLNDIASSFSAFAKMPEPVIKPLELVGLLKRTIGLHSASGELHFDAPVKELHIKGDEQLLGRTFSNLILNALQAARPGHPPAVWISIQLENSSCIIIFRDNGRGIRPEVAERIFIPHFTTKKSGSGLGLAIARQAIEQMGGKIWFETQANAGTTFYIELPC